MRLIRLREVIAKTGQGKSSIYDNIAKGTFPAPVPIGKSASAWVEEEVDDWMKARIADRDAKQPERAERAARIASYRRRETVVSAETETGGDHTAAPLRSARDRVKREQSEPVVAGDHRTESA